MINKKLLYLLLSVLVSDAYSTEALPEKNSAPWVGVDLKGEPCVGKGQEIGPFDYIRKELIEASNLSTVEDNHFTANVENLVSGVSGGSVTNDLDYTLRAWPNHQRALLSLVHYQQKIDSKLVKNNDLPTPSECYFQRAINFSPKDIASISLYGYFLRKTGHFTDAAQAYEKAMTLAPNTSKIEYAYSLLLIDLKQYDAALVYAKKAYQHGKPPKGLKQKLVKLGVWK